jgi:hypothetical protein
MIQEIQAKASEFICIITEEMISNSINGFKSISAILLTDSSNFSLTVTKPLSVCLVSRSTSLFKFPVIKSALFYLSIYLPRK